MTTTTSTAPVALNVMGGFTRVIPAKFTTRNGAPMQCATCGDDLVDGQAFAATPGQGWVSYCSTCATNTAAFVQRYYGRLATQAANLAGNADVAAAFTGAAPALQAFIASPDNEPFRTAVAALNMVKLTVESAQRDARVQVLTTDPLYMGLALATDPSIRVSAKFKSVAESMIDQWERKGSLSAAQVRYAEVIAAAARKAESKGAPVVDWAAALNDAIVASGLDDGCYAVAAVRGTNDLTFARIGTSDTGARIMRHIVGGHPEFAPGLAWCEDVLAAVALAGALDAQVLYGQQIGRCGVCNRTLTDQVSRDRGIGPHCAKGLGL